MRVMLRARNAFATFAAAVFAACAGAVELEGVEEVIVRAEASVAAAHQTLGGVATVPGEDVELVRPNHPSELLARVPAVWVARGSGQEHLTAIRSGVLAGAGACGEFLFLENGIPIRPAGFCNVNNLFELNIEQAAAVETVRGPASALFGGNAVHGVINVVTSLSAPAATDAAGWRIGVEAGPFEYAQLRLGAGGGRARVDVVSTSTAGYRADTGYGQHKASFGARSEVRGWDVTTTATATLLNQETGGYVLGFKAYDSPGRRGNPNPEAFRDAWSVRAASAWRRGGEEGGRGVAIIPYARRSGMTFLQHFLPGQPLERNAQTSAGVLLRTRRNDGRWRWTAGVLAEVFAASLREHQQRPTRGSPFLMATRPAGTHYDYRVRGVTLAVFHDSEIPLGQDIALVASGRAERNSYAYDNRQLTGNTRDDGTACGFGGCLHMRPADRDDAFNNVAGRLGVAWSAPSGRRYHLAVGQGFRPPQTTELYRLQRGQTVADLNSERLRSVEVGARGAAGAVAYDVTAYVQTARNRIFRDARGFNVGDGRTESRGVEASLVWRRGCHTVDLAATYAEHRYAFDRDAGRGERIRRGNLVDTAPRRLGSARWRWRDGRFTSEFEAVLVGDHHLDAANTAKYDGHTLLHWRGAWRATGRVKLFGRVINLLDAAYAERADFAFGNYRYFPGMPRQIYAGVEIRQLD